MNPRFQVRSAHTDGGELLWRVVDTLERRWLATFASPRPAEAMARVISREQEARDRRAAGWSA